MGAQNKQLVVTVRYRHSIHGFGCFGEPPVDYFLVELDIGSVIQFMRPILSIAKQLFITSDETCCAGVRSRISHTSVPCTSIPELPTHPVEFCAPLP